MERLRMRDITDIIYRLRKGQSERAIASDVGRHRATVRQYREFAARCGYLDPQAALPTEEQLLKEFVPPPPPPCAPSSVEPYATLMKKWVNDEIEMRAMHRILCEEHGYTGSYSAVRRYVAAHFPVEQEVFVRIETSAGEEAQVDFGTGGQLFDPLTDKLRLAYCFVMTLSHSRHMYVEFVFDQKIATFVACHKRAFAYLGGVVKRVVIDNLKAAVLKTDLEDPVLSIPYKKLAQHYGFLISPCRPRTPRHKGKVESGISFVKGNLWPSLKEMSVGSANEAALKWLEGYAGSRIHGTTRRKPIEQFRGVEREALAPLPSRPFDLFTVREAKVHLDQHLWIDYSYYSAPIEYVRKKLEVYVYENMVQLYDGVKLVFTHPRATEPGQRITHPGHQPRHKAAYLQLTPERCLERARDIGASCFELAEVMLQDRPRDKRRALARLVSLVDTYGNQRVDAACKRAVSWQDPRYTRVKQILQNELDDAPVHQLSQNPLSLPVPTYRYARSAEEFFGESAPARKEGVSC